MDEKLLIIACRASSEYAARAAASENHWHTVLRFSELLESLRWGLSYVGGVLTSFLLMQVPCL